MTYRLILVSGLAWAMLGATETRVQMRDLPEPVQRTVKEQTKGAVLRGLTREVEGGKTYYEAETTVAGRSRDILIDVSGAVVEVEDAVALESIPEAARKAFQSRAGSGRILSIESVTKGPAVTYEAVIEKNGKKSEVAASADGRMTNEE